MEFNCGDVITKCKPFVHTLDQKQKSDRCDSCFKLNKCLLKCANCKSVYYCDKKCQKRDWIECHRKECKILSDFGDKLTKDCDRFLLRLWLLMETTERHSEIHELFDGSKRCFDDLMTHSQQIREHFPRIKTFDDIYNRFKSCDLDIDYEKLFQLFCKICINSFSIVNDDLNEIGSGLYICGSVFNHSCQPNAASVFNGIDLEVRAIKQIKSNEEVLISYIDIKADRYERRERLRNQYYFECNCLKCSTLSDTNIDYSLVQSLVIEMDDLIGEANQWEKCYSIAMQSIPLYEQIYGDFHPDLTIQLMRVLGMKLLITEENLEDLKDLKLKENLDLIQRIENSIQITHGFQHKLFAIFKKTIGF